MATRSHRPAITLDVSPAVHHRAGLGRYAGALAAALIAAAPSYTLQAFYAEADRAQPAPDIASMPAWTSRLGYKPWRLAAMASHFLRRPMDRTVGSPALFHATDHLLPHLRAKTLFTLHDLIFEIYPEHHKRYNHLFLSLMMPRFLRAADHILTVSEQSKRDAMRLYEIPAEKMTVVYEAADPKFAPASLDQIASVRQRYGLPEQFVLHVGTIEPRKNLTLLLELLAALKGDHPDLRLVLVGKKGWLYEPFFEALAESGLTNKVIFPGFVADDDLPALYSAATFFAFPSWYEGFGLPPLEALACATPVLCSDRSSLPEVVGDAGLLLPPDDPKAWIDAAHCLLADEDLQRQWRRKGPRQAAKFSWQRAAAETVAIYDRLLLSP